MVAPEVVVATGQLGHRGRAVDPGEEVGDASPVHVAEGLPPQVGGGDGGGRGRRRRGRGGRGLLRRRGRLRGRRRGLNLGRHLGRDGRRGGLHDGAAVHGGEDALVGDGLRAAAAHEVDRQQDTGDRSDHQPDVSHGLSEEIAHAGLLDQLRHLLGPVAGTRVGLRGLGGGGGRRPIGGGDHHYVAGALCEPLDELGLDLGPERREDVRVLSPRRLFGGHGGRRAREKLGLPAVVGRRGQLVLGCAVLLSERILHADVALEDLRREEGGADLVGLGAQVGIARGQGFLAALPARLEAGLNHQGVGALVDETEVVGDPVVVGKDPVRDRLGRELRGLLEVVEAPLGSVREAVELAEARADLEAIVANVLRDPDLARAIDVRALPAGQRKRLQALGLVGVGRGQGFVVVVERVLPHEPEPQLDVRPSLVPAVGALEAPDADRIDEVLLGPVVGREEFGDALAVGVEGGVVVHAPSRPGDDGLVGVGVGGVFGVLRIVVVAHRIALFLQLLLEIVRSRQVQREPVGVGGLFSPEFPAAVVDYAESEAFELCVICGRPLIERLRGELGKLDAVQPFLVLDTLQEAPAEPVESDKDLLAVVLALVSGGYDPAANLAAGRGQLLQELCSFQVLPQGPSPLRKAGNHFCACENSCSYLPLSPPRIHVIEHRFGEMLSQPSKSLVHRRDGGFGHRLPLKRFVRCAELRKE